MIVGPRTVQPQGGTGRIPHSSLRDAANPSGEFDCARLRELLVGKYAEAKGGSIVKSLLANFGILEGEGRVLHPVEVETAATVGADVVKNFACLGGSAGLRSRIRARDLPDEGALSHNQRLAGGPRLGYLAVSVT